MTPEKITRFYRCQLTTTDSVKQHKLRKLIAWLSDKEGRGKEFVSLYIPPRTSSDAVIANLRNELHETTVIVEPRSVEERGQAALKSVIQQVRQHKEIPENGLALFAGAFKTGNQESEILNVEEIIPPEPVINYLYVVDDHFLLEPLRQMLRDQRIVGLMAVDSKEASFGIFEAERLEIIETITSGVSGKTGKGGQSQRRYERERDMELANFFHRVSEHATSLFLERHKVTSLIVGGPGPTKHDFLSGNYLHYELRNMLLSTVDTQSADREAVREVLNKSSNALNSMCLPEEKKMMTRLLAELSKQDGLAIAGLDAVLEGLKNGEVEVALATNSSALIEIIAMCKKCGLPKTKIVNKNDAKAIREIIVVPCEKCHAAEYEVEEKDMIDVLEDAASQTDARVQVIATDSEEKAKLINLGGFAALLRYRTG
ncbi:MAG TPA: peptide chain release factor aRF-1 [Candidatus Limnocylindrales bacterium]|nr:peptide chain release factor aRF-1 [Candidatus Limnocylindrales bacterium]